MILNQKIIKGDASMIPKRIFISCVVAVLLFISAWFFFSEKNISISKAKQIAARALIGKPRFSGNVPVNVEDRKTSYAVFFTHPLPGGKTGEVYKSFAVIDKQNGEVLEIGVTSPSE